MDQGFIYRWVECKVLDDRCYTEEVRAEHKTDDDDHEPAESSLSGKTGTEFSKYLLNKTEHTVTFIGCCAGIGQSNGHRQYAGVRICTVKSDARECRGYLLKLWPDVFVDL